MMYKLVIKSVLFLSALFTLTSCYTQLGYVNREYSSEDYNYNEDAYADEYDQEDISVVYNVYVPPYYDNRQIYFDPYDAWYFQPGFSFYLGYYSGPVFYPDYGYHVYPYEVYYYPPYINYNPYYGYHHGYYHGYFHGYYDGYYQGYYPTHYASYSRPMERRDFSRRSEKNLANRTSIGRRGSSDDIAYVGDRRPSVNSRNLVPAKSASKTRSGQVDRLPVTRRSDSYAPVSTKQKARNQSSQRVSSSGSKDSNTYQRHVKSSNNQKSYNQENSNKRRETNSIRSSSPASNSSGSRVSSSPSSRQSTPSYRPSSSSSSSSSSGTSQKSSSTSGRRSSGKSKRR